MTDPYPPWLYPAAWLAALLASSLILVYMHWRTGDLRRALIASLLWLKAAALVLWVAGLDRPLFTLAYISGGRAAWDVTVTANLAVTALLAVSNSIVWAWPELSRELIGRREQVPGLRRA